MEYVNPTDGLTKNLLLELADELEIYGFGYVSEDTLKIGLQKYIIERGPFDLIFTNERVLFSKNAQIWIEASKRDLKKSHLCHFNFEIVTEALVSEINNTLSLYDDKLVIFMLQTDFYNFRLSSEKLLSDFSNARIISFGKDLISPINELTGLKHETFLKNPQDTWYNFAVKNNGRICSVPHFISISEIFWGDISNRKYDLAVPGVLYYARKEIVKIAKKEHIKLAPSYTRNFNIAARLGINIYGSKLGIEICKILFNQNIKTSKTAFTCGSALKWPLRKFFEIPALGTALICIPFKNALDHGFINNETCFTIKDTEDFKSVYNEIIADTQKLEKVASAGRDMIIELHSVKARSKSISMFLGI